LGHLCCRGRGRMHSGGHGASPAGLPPPAGQRLDTRLRSVIPITGRKAGRAAVCSLRILAALNNGGGICLSMHCFRAFEAGATLI
jgi:hypothetical protein